jgi:hypothetical protein
MFRMNNPELKVTFILVGNKVDIPMGLDTSEIIIPLTLPNNIEKHKTLLTFTAWYALAKNRLVKTPNVGIFEYDTIFNSDPYEINFKPGTIYGALKRDLPEWLFLDCIPFFKNLLKPMQLDIANTLKYWSATSNLIMPDYFLSEFTEWYMQFIPKILENANHPHFHERAINVFAANYGYHIEILPYLEHIMCNSHKIQLTLC